LFSYLYQRTISLSCLVFIMSPKEEPANRLGIPLAAAFGAVAAVKCFLLFRSFRRNLAAARASGLPYVIVPCVLV
jgi:hypothetical protein